MDRHTLKHPEDVEGKFFFITEKNYENVFHTMIYSESMDLPQISIIWKYII